MSNGHKHRWAASLGIAAGATFAAALVGLGAAPTAGADDTVSDLIFALDPLTFNPAPDDLLGSVGLGADTLLTDTGLNFLTSPILDNVAGSGVSGIWDFW